MGWFGFAVHRMLFVRGGVRGWVVFAVLFPFRDVSPCMGGGKGGTGPWPVTRTCSNIARAWAGTTGTSRAASG